MSARSVRWRLALAACAAAAAAAATPNATFYALRQRGAAAASVYDIVQLDAHARSVATLAANVSFAAGDGVALPGALRCRARFCVVSTLSDSSESASIVNVSLAPGDPAGWAVAWATTLPDAVAPGVELLDEAAGVVALVARARGGQALVTLDARGAVVGTVPLANGDQLHLGGTALCAGHRLLASVGGTGGSGGGEWRWRRAARSSLLGQRHLLRAAGGGGGGNYSVNIFNVDTGVRVATYTVPSARGAPRPHALVADCSGGATAAAASAAGGGGSGGGGGPEWLVVLSTMAVGPPALVAVREGGLARVVYAAEALPTAHAQPEPVAALHPGGDRALLATYVCATLAPRPGDGSPASCAWHASGAEPAVGGAGSASSGEHAGGWTLRDDWLVAVAAVQL